MGSSHVRKHPQLARKLKLLYNLRLNPDIKSNADLARRLGITRQAIHKWCNGSATTLGDAVPLDQLDLLEAEFGIDSNWFSLTYEKFEPKVRRRLEATKLIATKRPKKISNLFSSLVNSKLCGRDPQLLLLDEAWSSPKTNVVQITGFGGVGKSSLVHDWLTNLDDDNYRGARFVYLWSFYWQGSTDDSKSSGDYFVEHALDWFGDKNSTEGTPWAKATRLINLIRSNKTLIVLDGLETLQHPPGQHECEIENPAISILVRELATDVDGLCVITSRLKVAELGAFEHGRTKSIELKNLSAEASTELLKNQGLHGGENDFHKVVQKYSGHPLSLTLLAGYLNVVYDGQISMFNRVGSLLLEKNHAYHARNIILAYLKWFRNPPENDILQILGIINRAISLSDLQSVVAYGKKHELTKNLFLLSDDDWSYAFNRLKTAKVAFTENRGSDIILDAHPLVRDCVADYLAREKPELWQSGNELLFKYLKAVALPDLNNMVDLEPLFRAVIHGCRAGLYQEAYAVYFQRVKSGYVMLSEGSHYLDQSCIRSFFEKEWIEPVGNLPEQAKSYLLSSAAANLMVLGHIEESIAPMQSSISLFIQNQLWLEAAGSAGPYISMLIEAGRIGTAVETLNQFEPCVRNTNNTVIDAMAKIFRAFAYYLMGRIREARNLFEEAEEVLVLDSPGVEVNFPTVSSYYTKFLLEVGDVEKAYERSLLTFEWRNSKSWQVKIDTPSLYASDILVLGMIYLQKGMISEAGDCLNKQISIFRSSHECLYMPTGLNYRALYFIEIGEFESAELDLMEAIKISKRTGAAFGEWEAYLNFMILKYKQGDIDAARKHLANALAMPKMRLYRFRNEQIEDYASKLGMAVDLD